MGWSARGKDLDRRTRRVLLAWAAACYAVAVAMVPLVWHDQRSGPANRADRWGRGVFGSGLTRLLRDLHVRPTADRLFPHMVALGQARDIVAMAVLLGLFSLLMRDWLGLTLCAVGPVCAIVLTEFGAKPLVHRIRYGAYQYPSGHCTGAAAIGALGIFLLYRHGGRRAVRWWGWIFIIPPVLVFVSVQRLGWHDLTEAIAGLAVGIGTVLIVAVALTEVADLRHRRADDDVSPVPAITVPHS